MEDFCMSIKPLVQAPLGALLTSLLGQRKKRERVKQAAVRPRSDRFAGLESLEPRQMMSVDLTSLVTIGGKGAEAGQRTVVDHSGEVYTVGTFEGRVDFDPSSKSVSLTGQGDPGTLYFAKYDAAGKLLWAHQLGADTVIPLLTAGIVVDSANNLYIVGSFEGSVDFDPDHRQTVLTSAGHHDIYVAKYDVLGELEWAKRFGGEGDDIATAATFTTDGLIAIAGRYTGEVDFDPNVGVVSAPAPAVVGDGELDAHDGFVNLLDDQGRFANGFSINTPLIDAVTTDEAGSLYLAGHFQGVDVNFDPYEGSDNLLTSSNSGLGTDLFFAKFDSSLIVQWVQTLTGTATINGMETSGSDLLVIGSASNVVSTSTPDSESPISVSFPSGGAGFIASTDAGTGEFQWINQLGSSVTAMSIVSGTAFVTGVFSGTADLDPSIAVDNFASATPATFVGSYSADDGSLTWARALAGTGSTTSTSIGVFQDDIVVGGSFTGTTDFDPNKNVKAATSVGSTDTFVVRLRQIFAPESLPFNAHITARFVDADGDLVTVSMKGPGGGIIYLNEGDIDTNISSLALSNTTAKTTVTITNLTGSTAVGGATVTGSLGNFSAPAASLQGASTVSGDVKKFTLGDASGSLTISGDTTVPALNFGNVSNFALTTVAPIKSLTVGSWSGSGAANKIVAPSVGKVVATTGTFTPNITLSAINLKANAPTLASVSAAGLIGGTWNITGHVGTVNTGGNFSAVVTTDSINSLTVGGDMNGATLNLGFNTDVMTLARLAVTGFISGSTIRSSGNIGSIMAGAFRNSIVFAGVAPIFTTFPSGSLPDSQSDFSSDRMISSVQVTGIEGVDFTFINTDIAARNIGNVNNLGLIQLANSNVPFGIAAANIGTPPSLESQGDFEVRILRV
jgi:hypothetical protein